MKGNGLFHQFEPELCSAIVMLGMADVPAVHECNNKQLENQCKSKDGKGEDDDAEKYRESYRRICWGITWSQKYNSVAYWKGSARTVNEGLRNTKTWLVQLNSNMHGHAKVWSILFMSLLIMWKE